MAIALQGGVNLKSRVDRAIFVYNLLTDNGQNKCIAVGRQPASIVKERCKELGVEITAYMLRDILKLLVEAGVLPTPRTGGLRSDEAVTAVLVEENKLSELLKSLTNTQKPKTVSPSKPRVQKQLMPAVLGKLPLAEKPLAKPARRSSGVTAVSFSDGAGPSGSTQQVRAQQAAFHRERKAAPEPQQVNQIDELRQELDQLRQQLAASTQPDPLLEKLLGVMTSIPELLRPQEDATQESLRAANAAMDLHRQLGTRLGDVEAKLSDAATSATRRHKAHITEIGQLARMFNKILVAAQTANMKASHDFAAGVHNRLREQHHSSRVMADQRLKLMLNEIDKAFESHAGYLQAAVDDYAQKCEGLLRTNDRRVTELTTRVEELETILRRVLEALFNRTFLGGIRKELADLEIAPGLKKSE